MSTVRPEELMAEVSGGRVQGRPRLGLCEGGLWQQMNDDGFYASTHERSDRVENPGTYMCLDTKSEMKSKYFTYFFIIIHHCK